LVGKLFKDRAIQKEITTVIVETSKENKSIIKQCPKKPEERMKLKELPPNLELLILLNQSRSTTGRQHDKAKLETRQFSKWSSRQLKETSQQTDSYDSASD
jgi:hypothetical protein